MILEVFLRGGEVLAVPDARVAAIEWVVTATGFRPMLVCRGVGGGLVARMSADETLAYRWRAVRQDGTSSARHDGPAVADAPHPSVAPAATGGSRAQ